MKFRALECYNTQVMAKIGAKIFALDASRGSVQPERLLATMNPPVAPLSPACGAEKPVFGISFTTA